MAENNRTASLLAEHARLLNAGFPKEETEAFWEEVSKLNDEDQRQVRQLSQTAEALKTALSPLT